METVKNLIAPKDNVFDLHLREIWHYRDLLLIFVHRDFVTIYKQTILGPLWFFIQPLFTTIIFTVIFGNVARIPTDKLPPILFYLAGITAWNYFADCFKKTADTFTVNANIFGKVFFPRVIIPLSITISNLIAFGIQFLLFLGFLIYFISKGAPVHPNIYMLCLPFLVFLMGVMGLGFGMLVSAMTTKYRDLHLLVAFGIQLMMYGAPIIYPVSFISPKYQWIVIANPMTSVIELFRYSFLGAGSFTGNGLIYSTLFAFGVFLLGLLIFNRTEKNFMDTI